MPSPKPYIVVIGGPNGAGKTTIALSVLHNTIGLTQYVNADVIAAGLSVFVPETAAFAAGRVMLKRLHELADAGESFAFETTLASRTFAPWLRAQITRGYDLHLIYIHLRSADRAIKRVAARVRRGGHSIPSEIIRRRFGRSARNFLSLYMPIATSWVVYDNSGVDPALAASGALGESPLILIPPVWNSLHEAAKTPDENE